MSRLLYSIGWWLATPLVVGYLLWRSRLQPEYRRHWTERWSLKPTPRIEGPLVWVHAVSVGETRAAQPLITALLERDPTLTILLTHMTPTGRATGEELFVRRHAGRVLQAYLPYDYAGAMRRFLLARRPQLGIVMETELWPNLCAAASALDVPLALVNARLSERSLRKGMRWRSLMEPAIRSLSLVVAQTDEDARRIRLLGRDDVQVAGNMKFDVNASDSMLARGKAWRAHFGGRPVLLAASTRDGEEALLLDAFSKARVGIDSPLLVIVPRHPQRFDEVERAISERGLAVMRRSAISPDQASTSGDPLHASPAPDVLLGDSMGEMFAYYGMADVAIIGGSLLPFGGQNLIEACAAGVPVILGPHTYNFADAADQAICAGAATRVEDALEAMKAGLALCTDEGRRLEMASRALGFAHAHQGATARTVALLARWV